MLNEPHYLRRSPRPYAAASTPKAPAALHHSLDLCLMVSLASQSAHHSFLIETHGPRKGVVVGLAPVLALAALLAPFRALARRWISVTQGLGLASVMSSLPTGSRSKSAWLSSRRTCGVAFL